MKIFRLNSGGLGLACLLDPFRQDSIAILLHGGVLVNMLVDLSLLNILFGGNTPPGISQLSEREILPSGGVLLQVLEGFILFPDLTADLGLLVLDGLGRTGGVILWLGWSVLLFPLAGSRLSFQLLGGLAPGGRSQICYRGFFLLEGRSLDRAEIYF